MKYLRTVWWILKELAGETAYGRYCAHLRARHPEQKIPTEREFYLTRLEEKYTRSSRCC